MTVQPAPIVGSNLATESAASYDFVLPAADGYPLAARLWCSGAAPIRTAVINAGAGIGMRFYDRFAHFLAINGVPTLVYDYRGIGQSRPKSLRGFKASVEDWGSKDCAAALASMRARFPTPKHAVIGHSVGGFVTGFVADSGNIDTMLLVGAHTGYWRDYASGRRLAMYLLWHTLMPALTRVVGYFPGRRLHLLDDLPAGVALEWASRTHPEFWWNRVAQDGTPDIDWRDRMIDSFLAVRAPTLALRFTDDAFATQAATERILRLYENCPSNQVVLGPKDVGRQKIGHFGFFRSRFRDTLWPRALAWLLRKQ